MYAVLCMDDARLRIVSVTSDERLAELECGILNAAGIPAKVISYYETGNFTVDLRKRRPK